MKSIIVTLLILFSSNFSFADDSMIGHYFKRAMMYSHDFTESECKSFGGTMNSLGCAIEVNSSVLIEKTDAVGSINIDIIAVSPSGSSCSIDGIATPKKINGQTNSLVLTQKVTFLSEQPESCEVVVTQLDAQSVKVEANGDCLYFCGAGADFTIKRAIK